MEPLKQIGTLPYVESERTPLVLLITTRGTGRWTIPKGWPKLGLSSAELAAQEAFEEAGVAGEVSPQPIGSYVYTKRLHLFSWTRCRVEVYVLGADRQHLSWPEKESRSLKWVEPREAATLVKEPQLAAVLREFDRLTHRAP